MRKPVGLKPDLQMGPPLFGAGMRPEVGLQPDIRTDKPAARQGRSYNWYPVS
jgi:hypothetical protein